MNPAPALRIDQRALETATCVGPVAWLVLEHLALSARGDAGELVADASARSLASSVSVSKDTAAGALRRLADASLIERRPQHRTAGRFSAGGYVLRLPPGLERSPLAAEPEASSPPDQGRPARPGPHDQLTLLDHVQDPQS